MGPYGLVEVMVVSEHQSHSNGFGIDRPAPPDERRSIGPSRLSRYDLVLLAIPLVLLLAGLVGSATAVPVWTAVAVGALASLPLLADAMAVNPPR